MPEIQRSVPNERPENEPTELTVLGISNDFKHRPEDQIMNTDCRICNARADSFAHATILNRHEIEYFRCRDCEFIQTETPYWLDEAYADAIVSTDVGLISRNEKVASIVDRTLKYIYPGAKRTVDYGGGYGMLTRMLRDRGHDCSIYDPYCDNLFAAGFEAKLDQERFELLTAFEVFEHLAEPHKDLQILDRMADHWLISTELVPHPAPQPNEWWYYVLDGGQHVSLWSVRALQAVASQYKRQLVTTRRGIHLLSAEPIRSRWATYLLKDRSARLLDRFRRRPSLLQADFRSAVAECKRRAA